MAKFPTYKQHYYATVYSQKHTRSGGKDHYEPDGDNFNGASNFRRKLNNPASFTPKMKSSYLNYLSRTQIAGKVIKFL